MDRARLTALLVILILATAACGGEEPEPTPDAIPEPVQQPEVAPAPESPLYSIEFVMDEDLVNVTWEWEKRASNMGQEDLITVHSPDDYALILNPDGTFYAKLDCNNGNGRYATDGSGVIYLELGPTTKAACPPESLADDMTEMFGPAQNYNYEENGNVLIFQWVAGGPWDYYRKAGTSPIVVDDALTRVIWSLEELDGQPLLPATYISAEFDEESWAAGSAGCNNYRVPYQADGANIHFGIGPMTMMLCPQPVMAQEKAYVEILADAATYEVTEDSLILFDSGGEVIAQYAAASQGLTGSTWEVVSYNNGRGGVQSIMLDTEITANFGEDGQVTGSAGCNDYFATYEAGDRRISVGTGGDTQKFCVAPDGIMEQEGDFLAALESVAVYRIDGVTMNMRRADGVTALNLRRVEPVDQEIVEEPVVDEITGVTWYWHAFQDTAEVDDFEVGDPVNYSLTLLGDGAAAIQADCNRVLWRYSLEGSSLTFDTLGPSTRAFCGEASLDSLFLSMLDNVVTYVTQDGTLYLNLFADAGNIVFTAEP